MARIRSIKPEFGTNEQLASVSLHARLTAALLPCHADKAGRLEDRPKRLKVLILPFDDCDMDRVLSELHKIGFIQRYQSPVGALIQITNFCKHQRPNYKEVESGLPGPIQTSPETNPDFQNTPPSVTVPDPVPDPVPELEGERERKPSEPTERESFDSWYAGYPKHEAKEAARKAWKKLSAADRQAAIDDGPRARRRWGADPHWAPQPATYLNGKRWTDEDGAPARASPAAHLNAGMENLKRIYEREAQNGAQRRDQNSGEGQSELVPATHGRHHGG